MGERSQPLTFLLWFKSNISIYKENCNIYRLWGMGWPRTSHLICHPFAWGWTSGMSLICHCWEAEHISASQLSSPWILFFVIFWIIYFANVEKTSSIGWSRETGVSDSHCILGSVRVDTWVWPSELPEFPSLAFCREDLWWQVNQLGVSYSPVDAWDIDLDNRFKSI